jgi:hypothetical protein
MRHRQWLSIALLYAQLTWPRPGMAAERASDGARPLGATTQLTYTPVPPCRIVDTRIAGGTMAPGVPRDFRVTGVGLQAQGGNPNGCGVPFDAAAAAVVNFVAVNATGAGDLRVWPYATPPPPPPNASVLNYAFIPGTGLNLANGIVVTLCDPDSSECPFDLRAQATGSAAHLVADVLGFFEPPDAGVSRSFSSVPAAGEDPVRIGPECTNVMAAPVTVAAKGPGTIVVTAVVPVTLEPVAGRASGVALHLGRSPDDCTLASHSRLGVPATSIAGGRYEQSVALREVIEVSEAGRYRFFLNARVPPDSAGALVQPAVLEGVFHPK